jgi:hypothetical protein
MGGASPLDILSLLWLLLLLLPLLVLLVLLVVVVVVVVVVVLLLLLLLLFLRAHQESGERCHHHHHRLRLVGSLPPLCGWQTRLHTLACHVLPSSLPPHQATLLLSPPPSLLPLLLQHSHHCHPQTPKTP